VAHRIFDTCLYPKLRDDWLLGRGGAALDVAMALLLAVVRPPGAIPAPLATLLALAAGLMRRKKRQLLTLKGIGGRQNRLTPKHQQSEK